MTHSAPLADNLELLSALAEDLHQTGYTVAAVEELLGPVAIAALGREQALPARRQVAELVEDTAQGAPAARALAGLISAWMLGDPVPVNVIDQALPRVGSTGAQDLGLGAVRGEYLVPTVDFSPYHSDHLGDLWVASGQTALQRRAPLPDDHVLGIGRASLTLAGLVPRATVARALDVGTGCGVQTFHLLAHAEHVTATDISAKALEFTRFNLLLNAGALGLEPTNLQERVSLRCGSLLEPVAGEEFDLVVSNPPFVISPPGVTEHTYRSSGHSGDAVTAELVENVESVLAQDGQAIMMANWEIVTGQAWEQRPSTWVERTGLDAWIIQRDEQDVAAYAETWLMDSSEELNPEKFEAGFHAYLADFSARNVARIGFGWLWLRHRRAEAQHRLRKYEEHTGEIIQPVATHWATAIENWTHLKGCGVSVAETLADTRICVPQHITEERYQQFGAEHPQIIMARSGAGFCRAAVLDTATAAVLSVSDGELTVGQTVAAVGGLLELEQNAVEALWEAIGQLVVDGFVELER